MSIVLAKSDPAVSLEEHIEDCLKVFQHLQKVLPALSLISQKNNFWELLFSSIYLHDWGKSHPEFQKVLQGQSNEWDFQRHELYSVPFVEKLNFSAADKLLIKRAVLGHHKDFDDLRKRWISPEELEERQMSSARKNPPKSPHDFPHGLKQLQTNEATLQNLQLRWPVLYQKYCASAAKEFCFSSEELQGDEHPYWNIARATLREQKNFEAPWNPKCPEYWQNFFLWGATKICDHLGSAKMDTLSILEDEDFRAIEFYQKQGYSHQQKLARLEGSCVLVAPTGAGKTEAALLWLQKQLSLGQGRAWYILPYTASINAMYLRLQNHEEGFSEKKVHLFHSKADLFFSTLFANEGDSATETSSSFSQEALKKIRDHDGFYFPLRIVTPFQILKWFYTVKGFEKGITQLAGAKLIFDEIHAYDARTFAQILLCLRWMREYLQVQTLVMTATLPSFLMNLLDEALGNPAQIQADETLKNQFKRHHVQLCEGTIFHQIGTIRAFLQEQKRVLVVCNTVDAAQKIFEQFPEIENKTLLHSRLIFDHRQKNEKQLKKTNNLLLVGTQSIEVSLDIDYDVLLSEPAPLDALLQRFGRINRKPPGKIKKTAPVIVCKEGGEFDHFIYDPVLVERTLTELEKIIDQEEGIVSESFLQKHLDAVYPHWTESQQKQFDECQVYFENHLAKLQPFQKNKEDEAAFYEQFTGIQVVPVGYFEGYKKHISDLNFAEAEKLLITITRGMYFKLKAEGLMEKRPVSFLKTKNEKEKIYESHVLVASCEYHPDLGLLPEQKSSVRLADGFL